MDNFRSPQIITCNSKKREESTLVELPGNPMLRRTWRRMQRGHIDRVSHAVGFVRMCGQTLDLMESNSGIEYRVVGVWLVAKYKEWFTNSCLRRFP